MQQPLNGSLGLKNLDRCRAAFERWGGWAVEGVGWTWKAEVKQANSCIED